MRNTLTVAAFLALVILMSACSAKSQAYRLILVERSKELYDLRTGDVCAPSGYDVETTEYKDGVSTAELWITYENCSAKEKVILDDRTKPQWGVPVIEKPKSKGSVGAQ